jgi:hypothetical protein
MAGSSNFTLHTSDGLPAGLPVQTKPNLGELEYLGNGLDGLVQTNPIWRDARWGLPPRAWRAPVVQTNPIPPVATGLAVQTNPIRGQPDGRRGSIMRQRLVARCRSGNKAKLGKAGASGGQPYKQSQFPGGAGRPSSPLDPPASPPPSQLRKTNPICPAEPGGTGPAGRGPWGKCAKRTEFRQSAWTLDDEVCKTNPVWASLDRAPTGERCKTNRIAPRGAAQTLKDAGTIMQNKANLPTGAGLGGRGVLYKQTQFLLLCRSGDWRSRGRLCKTKPIREYVGHAPHGEFVRKLIDKKR